MKLLLWVIILFSKYLPWVPWK